ncbi:Mth938-like domain-containing protein [Coralloluteibacterium stylophorae]|uniref:Mth938-like domain-containing protein n=1 Tax=Coralloluteibacterium stylophorae TaxID=1776034 RepID=A0A8J7VXU3_9GAMM|nr:Mth938-like domain-containing protein [Coralloluteibacterium stylophorae]MBS7459004.1 Mth938-like domain-containing protein [Coralloluteibacterium stylophorae]
MHLSLDPAESRYVLRGTGPASVLVNERELTASFALSADRLLEDWRPREVADLQPGDIAPLLALDPEVVVLGTGPALRFPAPAVMAACLTRGIGIEAMDNAAAARTFNVLVGEGRRAVAAFLLPG